MLIGLTIMPEFPKLIGEPIKLIGWEVTDKPRRRQTYLEYVRERLAVEKLMKR